MVVLLSPCELDNRMKLLLRIPIWSHRVVYIRGSALKDEDLERAKMHKAAACFILSARHVDKKSAIVSFRLRKPLVKFYNERLIFLG